MDVVLKTALICRRESGRYLRHVIFRTLSICYDFHVFMFFHFEIVNGHLRHPSQNLRHITNLPTIIAFLSHLFQRFAALLTRRPNLREIITTLGDTRS